MFICPDCGAKVELDFSPKANKLKWSCFCCPVCGHGQKEKNDYIVIKKLKIEFRKEV